MKTIIHGGCGSARQCKTVPVLYRPAEESDLDAICALVRAAVHDMEAQGIFQWDGIYPARADFLADIRNRSLSVGTAGDGIAVVYALNAECDAEYRNGIWSGSDGGFRVIHRLCVHPAHWNRGIEKPRSPALSRNCKTPGSARCGLTCSAGIRRHGRCTCTRATESSAARTGGWGGFI